jgi:putative ABC transport system permease protein
VLSIIATNLRRRPARTVLTAAGIAVGVATIVALLSFTQGLRESAGGFVHLGGSELGVFQANVSDPTTSVLPEALVGRLQAQPEVARATPLLLIVEGISVVPSAVVFGAAPGGFFAQQLVVVRGARPRSWRTEALVGDRLAEQLRLAVGGSLRVKGHGYRVAGIYHSGILFED